MIKSIKGGVGISVNGGMPTSPLIDMKENSAGLVRYNGDHLEVFDGGKWLPLTTSDSYIDFSPEAMAILSWAGQKMREEDSKDTVSVMSSEAIELLNWVREKKQEEEDLKLQEAIRLQQEREEAELRAKQEAEERLKREQEEKSRLEAELKAQDDAKVKANAEIFASLIAESKAKKKKMVKPAKEEVVEDNPFLVEKPKDPPPPEPRMW